MSYKTFEDMKHDIPEGATHYSNETALDYFAWVKYIEDEKFCIMPDSIRFTKWHKRNLRDVKPIPQTETAKEKEALDSMANNSESPNSSEWKNGDECVYMTHNVVHQFIGPCPKREGYGYIQAPGFEVNFVELSKLSRPETPEQKAERERLEGGYRLYCEFCELKNQQPKKLENFKIVNNGADANAWSEIANRKAK